MTVVRDLSRIGSGVQRVSAIETTGTRKLPPGVLEAPVRSDARDLSRIAGAGAVDSQAQRQKVNRSASAYGDRL